MTERIHISRRRVLAGLGATGLAASGAGLGTSAYFNDTESFTGNTLTAGELDLTVDWEEHYYRGDVAGAALVDSPDQVGDSEVGLPDPTDPMVAVPESQLGAFMDGTAIEAYPDETENSGAGDGVQDPLELYDACADFADLPSDMDPNGGTGLRTANEDTLTSNGDPKPLVSLDDVKPGDFGELTLSFHLCDNPGYVWLQGDLVDASENGLTEPEEADGDDAGGEGELIDTIQTLLWYDEDGDNVYEPGGSQQPVDVMLVFDKSESMNGASGADDNNPGKLTAAIDGGQTLVDALGGNIRVGLTVFADDNNTGVARSLGSSKADIKDDLGGLDGPPSYRPGSLINDDNGPDSNDEDNLNFETQTGVGIKAARDELLASNPNSKKIMVILSDGKPFNDQLNADNQASLSKNAGIEIYTIAYGSNAAVGQMAGWASDPTNTHAFVAPDPGDVGSVFGQIGQIIAGEEAFFRGSLRELLTNLESGNGIPLDGNRDTPFDERQGDPADDARDHFVASTNNFIGFAWWVPRSVGNAIQGDSVEFDLGFYTEQSRHNDGSGSQSA